MRKRNRRNNDPDAAPERLHTPVTSLVQELSGNCRQHASELHK